MRPKSPFLQNLRKKTPAPQMKRSERGKVAGKTTIPPSSPEGFQPFQWGQSVGAGTSEKGFETFSIAPEPVQTEKPIEPPPVDVAAEKRKSYTEGYEKAKAEFLKYKSEAERLEKGFQEILGAVQESRLNWVQEVREGVVEAMQSALHHIAQHPSLQSAILAQKLSEAMGQLVEEKTLTVFVHPEQVDFARAYIADQPGWTVEASSDVKSGAILESSNGVWDAQMQVTLDEIDDVLTGWMMDSETPS